MTRLLFICHCPSENTRALRSAALKAVDTLALADFELRTLAPTDAGPHDVEWCDGLLMGTTENFGAMAGLTKDFFERIYYPCLSSTQGLPFSLYTRAGEDGSGTVQGIGRIATGLRWKSVSDPLVLQGQWQHHFEDQVEELAMTIAAGLDAQIF
jgi:multimeric flavodoxin WrbA